ncbi:MAG: sigma 54-interacting transcriptional regulator [Thermoanaerobaculia bacterium]
MAVRVARSSESFDLRKKVLRLETLYDVSRALNVLRDEQALVDEIVARAVALLDAERGFGVVFEEQSGPAVVSTVSFPTFPGSLAAASDPFVLDLCRARGPLSRTGETVLGSPAGSVVGAPLVVRDRVLGVVVALDREAREGPAAAFDDGDRRFLESVAALAAPALDALRQLRALEADVDRLREENRALKGSLGIDDLLVGDSTGMRRVKELVVRAAASRVGVLIRGESGTGKELVARLLHAASPRREGAFLALNCAAVPETLLEAELFGIERGVATGVEARQGKFELASGGTIFLDEIADAPLAIQAKLLRVLQEREIERLGGRRRIPVDVRVVAATNADLERSIREKRFREDLYYRIRVVEIPLPPLRERREDIPRLIGHFLSRIGAREGRRPKSLAREAVARLLDYPFPGNVRELENLLEGAVALVPGETIEAGDLQLRGGRPGPGSNGSLDLATLELEHIRMVLESVGGNKSEAARILGINRRTLYRKHVPN